MGTAEILIVFSALMALIALVTIGIDWIGKPLKHRRFIPRMYRFDDEKLPVDEYGNTTFGEPLEHTPYVPLPQPAPMAYSPPHPYGQPQVAAPGQPAVPQTPASDPDRANPTVVVPTQPAPRKVAQLDPAVAAASTASRSAFSDTLAEPEIVPDQHGLRDIGVQSGAFAHSTIAGTSSSVADEPSPEQSWSPGMALDLTANGQKPSLAIKAERFWMATAQASGNSHFDDDDIARMASGKAPRRTNPRSGKTEAMQLTGLRQASGRDDVRMRWPDDAVDPWSTS